MIEKEYWYLVGVMSLGSDDFYFPKCYTTNGVKGIYGSEGLKEAKNKLIAQGYPEECIVVFKMSTD